MRYIKVAIVLNCKEYRETKRSYQEHYSGRYKTLRFIIFPYETVQGVRSVDKLEDVEGHGAEVAHFILNWIPCFILTIVKYISTTFLFTIA